MTRLTLEHQQSTCTAYTHTDKYAESCDSPAGALMAALVEMAVRYPDQPAICDVSGAALRLYLDHGDVGRFA